MAVVITNLGVVTAYGDAVAAGYTGTKAEWQALMASYATVAEEAAQSATDAETAKNAAVTAKTAAETAKTDAIAAKTAAQTAQTAAQTAATTATNKAQEATTAAQTATTKAGEASQSTSQASASAQTASTKASEASQSASTASAKATEATTAAATATSAATTATTAKDDAVSAKTAAQAAQTAAETAQGKAETAQEAAEDAAESVSASAAQIATNTSDISDLKEDLTQEIDNAIVPIEKTVTWQNGYIDTAGKIKSSSLSAFALVPMKKGEALIVGTLNTSICIIGSTTAESLSVGDTVTAIQNTSSTDRYEEYFYTARSDINIVLCVRRSEYKLTFYRDSNFLAEMETVGISNELQGVIQNCFWFSAPPYNIGYTKTYNGITYTILSDNSIMLDGTASAEFNLNLAWRSFDIASTMYYSQYTDDATIDYTKAHIRAGSFNSDNTESNGDILTEYNTIIKVSHASNAVKSRCYLHVAEGASFNKTIIRYFAYNKEPLGFDTENILTKTDIFNGEPYTGTYDWQTPVASYGALFKGKSNVESFAFFSDPHVLGFADSDRNETKMQNYLKRLQKTYRSTACGFIVSGGDWLNNNTTMDEACYRLATLKGAATHLLDGCKLVMGNHDTNYQGKENASSSANTGRLSNGAIASILYRDTNTKKSYYSFDGANSKCYVLDTGIEHNTIDTYDAEQLAWLASKLAEDDAEHSIIFMHMIIVSSTVQANVTAFGDLVEGYNAHTSVTVNGATYDFTSCTGKVELFVAGHKHTDESGTLGGVPYVLTGTNSYTSDVPLIDLFLVDYVGRKAYLVRVGGTGTDRTINLAT